MFAKYRLYIALAKKAYESYKAYKAGKKGKQAVKNAGGIIEVIIAEAQAGKASLLDASLVNENKIEDLKNRQAEYDKSLTKAIGLIRNLKALLE
jgi:hypothetical protein